MAHIRLAYRALLFSVILFSGMMLQAAIVSAAYSNLSSRLPDDSYKLRLPNGNDADSNGLNCYTTPPYEHGNCTAYGDTGGSHQYVTLSRGQINDSRRDADYPGADETTFSIYTNSVSQKLLSLDIVERAIQEYGCTGYSLIIIYSSPDGRRTSGEQEKNIHGCGHYDLNPVAESYFSTVNENGVGIASKANVSIRITGDGNRQASFHINTSSSAKMSYGADTWVNTYPTNAADGHKIAYSFRPACNIGVGSLIDIRWDNLDYPSSFQPNKPSVRLIRHDTNGNNRREVFQVNYLRPDEDHRTLVMTEDMFDGSGNPYSFSFEFDGIRGGNGVSFVHPSDSALAKIECPPRTGPEGSFTQLDKCKPFKFTAYQRNTAGTKEGRYYQVQIVNTGSAGTQQLFDGTSANGNVIQNDYNIEGRFSSSSSRTFRLLVQNSHTGQMIKVDEKTINDRNCNPPETWPSFTLAVTCDGVYIQNMDDINDKGNGVRVFGQYLIPGGPSPGGPEGWGLAGAIPEQPRVDSGGGQLFIPWPYEKSARGAGWGMDIGVYNLMNNGSDSGQLNYYRAESKGGCLQASCTVNISPVAGLPANSVKAGVNFKASVTIHNPAVNVDVRVYNHPQNPRNSAHLPVVGAAFTPNKAIPDSIGGGQFIARANGGNFNAFQDFLPAADSTVPRGGSVTGGEMDFTAQNTVGQQVLSMQPGFHNYYDIGDVCPQTINVYQPYLLTPTVDSQPRAIPNNEDPATIYYVAGVRQQKTGDLAGSPYYPYAVPGVTVSTALIYKQRQPSGSVEERLTLDSDSHTGSQVVSGDAKTYGSVGSDAPQDGYEFIDTTPGSQFYPGYTWNPGDQFCGRSTVSHHTGWIGPGENIANNQASAPFEGECAKVLNYPYARFYGGDVKGGGAFGAVGNTGQINGYIEDAASGSGTGAEFAAIAIEAINGFSTASLRASGQPSPPSGLRFANMGSTLSNPDYFTAGLKNDTADKGNVSSETPDGSGINDTRQTLIKKTSGKLRLAGNNNYSGHHAIFVEGDVVIDDDIIFTNTSGWAAIKDIPAFDLIVKGNIYISKTVDQLDGTYIAQPNNGTGGVIYTCARPFDATLTTQTYSDSELYDNCKDKPLAVNGVMVAQDLKLLRTYKTLRDIPYTETTLAPTNRVYTREVFGANNAAESFRLPPEYFLAKRAVKPDGSQANGEFDYYVTLPPVL